MRDAKRFEQEDEFQRDLRSLRFIIGKLSDDAVEFRNDSAFFEGELEDKGEERWSPVVEEYRKRRKKRTDAMDVARYKERRKARLDDEEEKSGSHGNTKIPFGLCQREGIEVQKGWTPADAWKALEGKGYSPKDVYKSLRKEGKVGGQKSGAKSLTLSDFAKPRNSDYDLNAFDSFNDFSHKNLEKLMPLYEEGGRKAILEEKYKALMEKSTTGLHELKDSDEIDSAINGGTSISDSTYKHWVNQWYGGQDNTYRGLLAENALSSPEVRNAALNLSYHMYKKEQGTDLSFEEWLVTPIKMYRGGKGKEHRHGGKEDEDRDFCTSFSFRKDTAEKFAKDYGGSVTTIEIRPIDTIGSPGAYADGECEIFVPKWMISKTRVDEADFRSDADDDEGRWVTTENDHKVHLNEEGVPDKGNPHVLKAMTSGEPRKSDREYMNAAKDADDAYEFWTNLTEDQQKRVGKDYKKIYDRVKKHAGEKSEWVEPKGNKSDMPTTLKKPEKPIEVVVDKGSGRDTRTADADDEGIVRLNPEQSDTWNEHVFYHEMGHQISQLGLLEDVSLNPGGLWGRYNRKHNLIESPDGVTMNKNPDENFADMYAEYRSRPDWLKEKAPDVHDYFERLEKDNPWLKQWVDDSMDQYRKTVDAYHGKKEPITKRRVNSKISEIANSDKSDDDKANDIAKEFWKLRKGTVITMPDSWADEDTGKAPKYIWDGSSKWESADGWGSVNDADMAYYFLDKDERERPKISSIPRDPESVERSRKERESKKHYAMMPDGSINGHYTNDFHNDHVTQEERDSFAEKLKEDIFRERGYDNERALYRGEANAVGDKVVEEVKRRALLRKGDLENAPYNDRPQVEDIYDVLRDVRDFGAPDGFITASNINSDIDKERTDALIKEAASRFPTDWFRYAEYPPEITIVDGVGRAHCTNGRFIYVYTKSDLGGGTIVENNDRGLVNTLAHEMGHYMEDANKKVGASARDCFYERCRDSELVDVEPGYKGYKDSFFNTYMGKIYGAYGKQVTEITSVLMENIGAFNPFDIMQGKEYDYRKQRHVGRVRDKESLGYILGVLAGL